MSLGLSSQTDGATVDRPSGSDQACQRAFDSGYTALMAEQPDSAEPASRNSLARPIEGQQSVRPDPAWHTVLGLMRGSHALVAGIPSAWPFPARVGRRPTKRDCSSRPQNDDFTVS